MSAKSFATFVMLMALLLSPYARGETWAELAVKGRKSFKAGDYRAAVKQYRSALRQIPKGDQNISTLEYWLSRSYFKLGNCKAALVHARPALRSIQNKKARRILAGIVKECRQKLIELKPIKVKITTGDVSGAKVHIDGKHVGETPYETTLKKKSYIVRITKEGYHDVEKALEVKGREAIVLDFQLRKVEVELFVECNVEGASIEIDGKPVGTTPQKTPVLLKPGEHVLSVAKPGYRAVKGEKIVASKEPVRLTIQLEELPEEKPATVAAVPEKPTTVAAVPEKPKAKPKPVPTVVKEPEPRTASVWKWVTIGLGVAIVAGGAGLQANASSLANDANDMSAAGFDSYDAYVSEYDSRFSSAESRLKGAYAMYGIGAAAVVGGIVWLILDRPRGTQASSAVVRPVVGYGTIKVEAAVRF